VQIVQTLKERGVRLSFLMDEGGTISQGSIPGVDAPVGLIGVAEKGHLSLLLRAQTAAGHASAPGQVTSIGALALAIATLENNPFPQDLEFVEFMMSFLAEELPFRQRMQLANRWLFGSSVADRFAATPTANANTRTTIAPTIIKGGDTENVLPAVAEALVNLRLMPGDTLVEVYKHVNEMVGDDVVEVVPAHEESLYGEHSWDPSEISDVDSPQFRILVDLIKATVPGSYAVPYLMSGATDARHYMEICDRVFRFSPFVLGKAELETVHGVNERLSFENASRMVGFYIELIERMSGLPTDFYDEAEFEESFEDEQEEKSVISQVEKPLPTRPMRKRETEVEEIIDEYVPLPEDDLPLETKPMKKE
jgi:carboxypeptidase PM20D1